jgi:hypothetical protein
LIQTYQKTQDSEARNSSVIGRDKGSEEELWELKKQLEEKERAASELEMEI